MSSSLRGLQAHESLLVACARNAGISEAPDRDAFVSHSSVDWPAFVRASVRHGLAQHAAVRLAPSIRAGRVPDTVAGCLARMLSGNRERNTVLFRETARITRALESAGISCLVLKGMALAPTVYSHHALRNSADIDILVRAEEYGAAAAIVGSLGYALQGSEPHTRQHHGQFHAPCAVDILSDTVAPEFDPALTAELLASHGHRTVLELHRGVFRHPSGFLRTAPLEPFWEQARRASLPGGGAIPIPSPESMLIHLADHAAGHLYRRLIFAVDVANVIGCWQVDWSRLVTLAEIWDARAETWRMLEFVHREFGAQVPNEALADLLHSCDRSHRSCGMAIARSAPASRSTRAIRGLIGGQARHGAVRRRVRTSSVGSPADRPLTLAAVFRATDTDQRGEAWARLRQAGSARDAARSLLHLLAPPLAVMRDVYGPIATPWLAACYLIRPFHLALRVAQLYRSSLRGGQA